MTECEKIDYSIHPEKITSDVFDCIWISLAKRSQPSPLKGRLLPWLDWKLRGQLVKLLLKEEPLSILTFIPTLNAVATPLLAILPNIALTPYDFEKNCQGLRLKSILYIGEENESIPKELVAAAQASNVKISWGTESA